MIVDDFDPLIDPDFMAQIAEPYFKDLFHDIAIRSLSPTNKDIEVPFIDNVAFFEFTKLPGIICDRFFYTFTRTKDNFILEDSFVNGLKTVYLSNLEEKMLFTFKM